VPVDSEWTVIRENPSQPLKYFRLHGLQPENDYQLVMRVGNKLGWSNYSSSYFVFRTPEGIYLLFDLLQTDANLHEYLLNMNIHNVVDLINEVAVR